jgi:hypothetical protein
MGAEDEESIRLVLGTVVLAINPLPPSSIAILIQSEKLEVMDLLQLVQSLLILSEDPNSPVLPFHKSFPDFITDPLRCSDQRFYISPGTGHYKLALHCLRLMNCNLKQNLLSLPDYVLNIEVQDLDTKIANHIGIALQYACKSWHNHLAEVRENTTKIIPVLCSFLQEGVRVKVLCLLIVL